MADRICENCMSRVPVNVDKCPRCGIRFENTNPGGALPNGWVLGGRYTVGRYIGIDGEGVTYSAIDGHTMQRVTVKEFMPVTLSANRDAHGFILPKPGSEVLFKTTKMDYAELYGILLRMGLTEGLVQVLDVLEENNTAYAVLEKLEGPTLAEYLTKLDKPIDHNRALAMMRPVMMGIEAMHAATLVHRGVSPENIILESGGTAKLGGYGTLALRQMGSELKPKLYPGYSAPEQYAASEFEGRYTDVYAFSAVLYRMLTGETPIPADERRIQDSLRPVRTVEKEVPGYLSSALSRAMRVTPAERIQTIQDLRLALSGESSRGAAGSGGNGEKKGPLGLTRQQLIVGAVALGAVVVWLLAVLLISLLSGDKNPDSSSGSASGSVSASASASADLTIPDFTGKLYTDIVNGGQYTQFSFAAPVEQYSDDVDVGKVISQTPKAGGQWDEKTAIVLTVSKGPEQVEMPDLVNKKIDEASSILNAMGVKFQQVAYTNDGNYEEGQVVRTDPTAGTKLTVGPNQRQVVLYVAGKNATVAVPNEAGKTRDTAVAELTKAGIKYTEQTIPNDGTAVGGNVQGTDPAAGTEIDPKKTTVTLKVYDKYLMPNLGGYINGPQTSLVEWLDARKANFTYNIVPVDTSDPNLSGVIEDISQPAVNSEVKPGTNITLYVYRYVAPPTPDPSSSEPPTPSESVVTHDNRGKNKDNDDRGMGMVPFRKALLL